MGAFRETKKIRLDTIIERRSNILFNKIEDEVVMLSLENNEYFGMEKVGSRIWELLENPLTFRQLINNLIEEYDVDERQCTKETITFIQKLEDKKLVITS